MKANRHNRQSLAALVRRANALPTPRDYYAGRHRPHLDVPDNLLLFCRHSAAELHDGSLQPHFHHRWVLIVPLQGRGVIHLDGRAHAVRPGMALLVPPLRLHRYGQVSPGRVAWLFITFDLPERSKQAAAAELATLTAEARRFLDQILDLWWRDAHDGSSGAQLATATALLLLALREQPALRQPAPSVLLERVNHWLTAHPSTPATLAELARAMGVSASHLRAVFRQEHGLSLGRYVRETRCRQAAVLLKQGNTSVGAVATALGFKSVYSFSRTFKRVLGMPPSTLRA